MKKLTFTLAFILSIFICYSQSSNLYMPKEIKKAYEKGTRSWDGKPGKNYWQNFSEYNIEADFIPDSCKIIGHEVIQYRNNSPDTLTSIYLMLKQNLYKKGGMRDFPIQLNNVTDGVKISSVVIEDKTIKIGNPQITTTMGSGFHIRLDSTMRILPSTETNIEINWQLTMPKHYEIRTGRVNDSAFFIGYWFPQIVVYDDVFGWDKMFYTGVTETYNDISNFKVKLKIPGDYLVWATGELQNPKKIYTSDFYKKIEKSKKTDEIIHLITKEDFGTEKLLQKKEFHQWNFSAKSVPDFSFAVAKNYVWDATHVITNKTNNQQTWVNVVYSPGDTMYPRAIDYAAKSINYFSTRFPNIPYPYSKHTTFQISEMFGGMEFPMMAANGLVSEPAGFADLTAHEIAHNYFPFLVNTNEERYAWMDEGWVTTFGKSFNNFIGLPEAQFWSFYKTFWNTENDFPLMIPSNNLHFYAIAFYYYEKPWKANVYLFEILKEKGITEPLKAFVERWKYKHPTPYDYFFTMEDILDEDLSWYWKAWYFEFHSPDLKIEKVNQKKNEIEIQITNTGKMPVPVSLKVEFENGEIDEYYKTAYVWKENSTSFIFKIKSENKVKKVILGNKDIIDVNPENNVWNNKVIP